MKGKSVFSALSDLTERNKYVKYGIYALAALIALALFLTPRSAASRGKSKSADAAINKNNAQTAREIPAERLEARLAETLSEIRGAGRVAVMITYDNTSEIVCATENESSNGETGSSAHSRPAKVSGSGGENPIILTEVQPKIRGVIVIAEGSANFSVKNDLISAVSTVLGIEKSKVEVFQMKPGK